jgi:hypothetical protein
VDGKLASDQTLIRSASNRHCNPGDDAPDEADLVGRGLRQRRQAMAICLSCPLTGEVEGDERVEGIHEPLAPVWRRGSASVVVADRIAAVGAQTDGGNIDPDEGNHDGNQACENVHRDLPLLRLS